MKFTGRPPAFQDADEVALACEEYFKDCIENDKPYTVSGLALSLGISTRQLRDYKNCVNDINILKQLDDDVKVQLSSIIKRAYQMCQVYCEERMIDPKVNKTPIGYLFSLKNFQGDWVDKTETVVENKTITIDLED